MTEGESRKLINSILMSCRFCIFFPTQEARTLPRFDVVHSMRKSKLLISIRCKVVPRHTWMEPNADSLHRDEGHSHTFHHDALQGFLWSSSVSTEIWRQSRKCRHLARINGFYHHKRWRESFHLPFHYVSWAIMWENPVICLVLGLQYLSFRVLDPWEAHISQSMLKVQRHYSEK